MGQPHKHAELIKAWADGAEIEYRAVPGCGEWVYYPRQKHLIWDEIAEFRIKPEPKPDVVKFVSVKASEAGFHEWCNASPSISNLRLTFDGETGKLKKAEVLE